MQQKKNTNIQVVGRKGAGSRIGSNTNQPINQSSSGINAAKEKQDAIFGIVKQYLEKSGYSRSLQVFRSQKPIKRNLPSVANRQVSNMQSGDDSKEIVNYFDKGKREEFFKLTHRFFQKNSLNSGSEEFAQAMRKLQFELQVYFCIYNIHPCVPGYSRRNQTIEKANSDAFKKYIDVKGQQVSEQTDLLAFFALPYIPKPQQNPSMSKVFTKQWVQKLKQKLNETIKQFSSKTTTANKENKKVTNQIFLIELYERFADQNVNESRMKEETVDLKLIQKYERENQELNMHNKQMVSYLDIMQQNLKDLNEASKNNILESNRKWFQFSKQIIQLTKKAIKGQNVKERIQKYEKFFGTNVDQLIYSTQQISLFERNSYTEDHSLFPVTRAVGGDKSPNLQNVQIAPIDINKIMILFTKADQRENQVEICLVLKALKERLCFHKNASTRRQVIVSYKRNDLCAINESNYEIQQKLLIKSPERVKQFYLRLMNYIATDDLGDQYLSESEQLIKNLIQMMGETTEQVPYRKHIFGILQKFSFVKKSQKKMISFGIIPMIFQIFRNEGEFLEDTSVKYLMGLIMNLAVKKQSIINFQKQKSQILPILLKYIDVEDSQIKGYVNGTIYVLLQLESIKKQAIQKYKIQDIITNLMKASNQRMQDLDADDQQNQNCVIRQYTYILERLQQVNSGSIQDQDDNEEEDQEDQQYIEDIQDMEVFSDNESNSSQYIEGEDSTLNGEDLLMKRYALLGPEAVRQEIINRSILDETSRKSNNMTTSINYSKRVDKVFDKKQRPQTPSLFTGNFDNHIAKGK